MQSNSVSINCLLTDGGLGDHVCSLVACDYILRKYPHVELLVWVPDYLTEFAKHLLPTCTVNNFTAAKTKYDRTKPSISTRWDGRTSGKKVHLLDYAFHTLCDEHVSNEEKNYLKVRTSEIDITSFNLPKDFAVITTGFTAPNREFKAAHINEIVKYIKEQGCSIVFLGKKETATGGNHVITASFSNEIDFSQGVDLRDATSLLQAAKIMSEATCVIGLDNGLLHVAGCTDATIVGGFTNVDPTYRMPVRYNRLGWAYNPVVPPESLGCRFCQTKMNFLYGHDYKTCYYENYKCLTELSVELWLNPIKTILGAPRG